MDDSLTSSRVPAGGSWPVGQFVAQMVGAGIDLDVPVLEGGSGARVCVDNREVLNFAGCSLLGMHLHPAVVDSFCRNARRYGLATGGSRLVQGKLRPIRDLEAQIALSTGKSAAITFASGALANIGFVHAMSGLFKMAEGVELDLSKTVFVLDRDCHWSLWKAVEKLRGSDRLYRFAHNDVGSLETVLKRIRGRRAVVMFESVYSVDGSIAPIRDIVGCANEYGALTYVDDANGYLVYDTPGRGFDDDFASLTDVTFRMVSLSKSIGLEGGAIAGPEAFIDVIEWLSGTSAFTSSILPANAGAALTASDVISSDRRLMDKYLRRARDLRESLIERGYAAASSRSYIINIRIGSDDVAEDVRREFLGAGFLIPVFRYPASRRNDAGIRLVLSALHTDADIASFLHCLDDVRRRTGF
ncbi:pyridoxal phosphate-dependent aminotransferase family protein [Actinomyces sp.]|uniref:aminotransferase class I/II-fold pyridoxal phosphate-dependent enzyme n=1 Tax=Actinomyces sp. TaxID=29317 RepID=UPI0026DB533B|nr:pyridoxal phosphate-dependent aminotransferase family protein [Actinomyces sp.]MDO4901688.1 pyridoxal phosphate-dependent aminotransferase family protein [Actinomyces sp.]